MAEDFSNAKPGRCDICSRVHRYSTAHAGHDYSATACINTLLGEIHELRQTVVEAWAEVAALQGERE